MKSDHSTVFNSTAHKETVRKMEEKVASSGGKGSVHDEGEKIFISTGKLDQCVNISGVKRVSRNAFIKNDNGTCTLVRGIKLPNISQTDGTGSMGGNVAKAFYAMGKIYGLLGLFSNRYQIDLSVSVVQDVQDKHPVVQMAEFESDNRAAEHVQKLVPDKDGGDATEDYDIGLKYVDDQVDTDIVRYGLKGYYFLILDNVGRGEVRSSSIEQHLGYKMQSASVKTRTICESLLTKWHLFCIQVGGSSSTTSWWEDKIGEGRVIVIDDADLLAEIQAGLVYVSETINPTESGLYEFLIAGDTNNKVGKCDAHTVWNWLKQASQHFEAQIKLPGYNQIPMPGDVFDNYRDVWPIGHTDKITPESVPEKEKPTENGGTKINWNKF